VGTEGFCENEGNVIGNQPREWQCNNLHKRQLGGRKQIERENGKRFEYKLEGR